MLLITKDMREIVIIILLTFALAGCNKDPLFKNKVLPTVETHDAEDITNVSAKVSYSVNELGYNISEAGILYGTHTALSIKDNKANKVISGLTPKTQYYYRAYILDYYNNAIYGEEKTFTTLSSSEKVKTVSIEQTSAQYSSSGFEFNGNKYKYVYSIILKFSIYHSSQMKEYGYLFWGKKYYFTELSDGVIERTWNCYSNTNPETMTFQAYAIMQSGETIYGEKMTISAKYPY